MRKELFAAALGFVIGAAALAVGQEDEGDLQERLERLQEAVDRARLDAPGGQDLLIRDLGQELRVYPVFDLTAGVPQFHARRENVEESADPYFPAGTIEELSELVRVSVKPWTWEQNAWMAAVGQTLLVGQSRAIHADVARFLDEKLRDSAHRCVTVEAQAVDMPRELYRALAAGASTALGAEQAQALAAALADGSAKRVFDVRATGLAGQHFVVSHGRQVAVVARAPAVVAKGVRDQDPEIEAMRAGGYLAVRPSLGTPGRITLDVDAGLDAVEDLAVLATGTGLAVDTPKLRTCRARTSLTVPERTWAIVGGGTPLDGGTRVLLVRATRLPRGKGGAK
jgi:hypothetical protein